MNTTLDTTLNALILDDDAWMLKILEVRLKNACPNINVVKREVADLTGDFDVYLIDNDFSGTRQAEQLAAQIRMKRPDALVIAISSTLDAATLRRLINLGCDGACDKSDPAEFDAVLQVVALHQRVMTQKRHATAPATSFANSLASLADLLRQWNSRLSNQN